MYLLDTNFLSEARKGLKANAGVIAFREQILAREDFIPAQAIGELRCGMEILRYRGDSLQAEVLETWLEAVLQEYSGRVLGFAAEAGQIWGRLMAQGNQDPIDKQIAAIALLYDLTVVTRNEVHFVGTAARVLNPFSETPGAVMKLWVKICGNTSLADAEIAVAAGANALGFLFAPSPRRVSVEQVAEIAAGLPKSIEKIGVFVAAGFEEIASAVEIAGLTGVQLHSYGEADLAARLRERFGPGLRILQVVHFGAGAEERLKWVGPDANLDGVLVDSRTAEAVGGTGVSFDWLEAGAGLFAERGRVKLIAAGGLTPENVAEAIALLRPWGVDVVSGVERSKGQKEPEKVLAFVRNARAAGDTLS